MWALKWICLTFCLLLPLVQSQRKDFEEKYRKQKVLRKVAQSFDIEKDIFLDLGIYVADILAEAFDPNNADITITIRWSTMFSHAWFDANAPFTDQSIGLTTRVPRRPKAEHTIKNKNTAIIYAWYRVLLGLLSEEDYSERVVQLMQDVGLNPNDNQENDLTPIGIGNKVGNAVIAQSNIDGMNQLGDANGSRKYHKLPYGNTNNYKPVNTAYELKDPSRWQPALESNGKGRYFQQTFVTPQFATLKPFTYDNINNYTVMPHGRLQVNSATYKATTDETLAYSGALTEEMKMKAEFFKDKVKSVFGAVVHAATARGLGIDGICTLDLMANIAMWDTLLIVWKEKTRWDAVRPWSALKHLYGNKLLTAWGGPNKGKVNDIPANQWRSYLPPPDHPEYPSATTGVCYAVSSAMQTYLGDDLLNWNVTFRAGSSIIEPGTTPSKDISVEYSAFSLMAYDCAQSRIWAGVHFQDAIDNIKSIGTEIGIKAANYVRALTNGINPTK